MIRADQRFRRIAFVGNYLPRRCGIATFTTDLCEAVAVQSPETACFALPVNDQPEGYDYPPRVWFEISQDEPESYRQAADYLNLNDVDMVCLQHEFGIFGGPAGAYVLALLRELRMPVVTTLHTVMQNPDADQRRVFEELVELSDRLVVMSQRGVGFLRDVYRLSEDRVDFIHHGIPDVAFVDPSFFKDKFGVEGKLVLSTFGLLSPSKGIEDVIDALPAILERHPNVVYIVQGATHPQVKRREGESYRLSLQRRAEAKGVDRNVIFRNRFVSLRELTEFIGMADIYVTPYRNVDQIVSGTLAYTVGAGKAVVSTPYWYARELLADERGVLVPFSDPEAIAAAVLQLLGREAERHAMRRRAYRLGREMIWPRVAERYMESFQRAVEGRAKLPRAFVARTLDQRPRELPEIDLAHLRRLTDGTGIVQHAVFCVPNYHEGYTTDDNARALMVAVLLEEVAPEMFPDATDLASRYMAFVGYALNRTTGRFRNFLSYDRRWLDDPGSEDCHGRALWALGVVAHRSRRSGLRDLANQLSAMALPASLQLGSPRAWAFALLGIHEYLLELPGDRLAQLAREELTKRLMALHAAVSSPDWSWFEETLTYANAALPHALLVSGHATGSEEAIAIGLESLGWLVRAQRLDGDHFVPIGNQGFHPRAGVRARFDQQPIEAQATISACLEAYRITGDRHWYREAKRVFEWYLGRNDLGISLYDPATGGCRDGLQSDRANPNQGAESTICFLVSLLEMRVVEALVASEQSDRGRQVAPPDEALSAGTARREAPAAVAG